MFERPLERWALLRENIEHEGASEPWYPLTFRDTAEPGHVFPRKAGVNE